MTDVRTWQQVLAVPSAVTIAFIDPSARAHVERWHLERARVRLLAVLLARVPDAPEPDDSDELARAFAHWNAVPCGHHVPGSCDFCPSEDR